MKDNYDWIVGWGILLLIAYGLYRTIKHKRAERAATGQGRQLIPGPEIRTLLMNMVLALIPDLLVCWAAAHLTNSGWFGYFIAFIALQAIYFFLWFKNAAWGWLIFWFYARQAMITKLENWLIENKFPVSENLNHFFSFDDYLKQVADNEKLECKTRVAAAVQLGNLAAFSSVYRLALLFQMRTTGEAAVKRYASLADRFAGRQDGERL